MREVSIVFQEFGAEIKERQRAKIAVKLNGHTAAFGHAGHSLPKEEIAQIREFLGDCGIDPDRDCPL